MDHVAQLNQLKLPYVEHDPPNGTIYLPLRASSSSSVGAMTAVFFPMGRRKSPHLDLVLYLHGIKDADDIYAYLQLERYTLRERLNELDDCSLVLVAPSLGWWSNADLLLTMGLDRFLDQVLDGIAEHGREFIGNGTPVIDNLYLAAHSAGGAHMLNLVSRINAGNPGEYRGVLRECWGFDCLYGDHRAQPKTDPTNPHDPEERWLNFCSTNRQVNLSIFYIEEKFGGTTAIRSVNLDTFAKKFLSLASSVYLGNIYVTPSEEHIHGRVPRKYLPTCISDLSRRID